MTDYRCPSCDGGFPESAASDGCPWCGESMDGARSSGITTPAFDPTLPNRGPLSRERKEFKLANSTPDAEFDRLNALANTDRRVEIMGADFE